MIQLQLKNKHIYFAIESIFSNLDPRFSTHLWQLVTTNSNDEYLQTVEIPKSQLVEIYKAVSRVPEGIAAAINKEINDLILPQLVMQSGMTMQQIAGIQETMDLPEGFEDNEIAQAILEIATNNRNNYLTKLSIIEHGKQLLTKPYN